MLPVLGQEESTAPRPLLRAGYMGHVTQVGKVKKSEMCRGVEGQMMSHGN